MKIKAFFFCNIAMLTQCCCFGVMSQISKFVFFSYLRCFPLVKGPKLAMFCLWFPGEASLSVIYFLIIPFYPLSALALLTSRVSERSVFCFGFSFIPLQKFRSISDPKRKKNVQ